MHKGLFTIRLHHLNIYFNLPTKTQWKRTTNSHQSNGAASKPDRVVQRNRTHCVTVSCVVCCIGFGVRSETRLGTTTIRGLWQSWAGPHFRLKSLILSPERNKIKNRSAKTATSLHYVTATTSAAGPAEANKRLHKQLNHNLCFWFNSNSVKFVDLWVKTISHLRLCCHTDQGAMIFGCGCITYMMIQHSLPCGTV